MIKLAAIDIGSNAVRLMLSRVYGDNGETSFIKESLVRMPLRLGEDVFAHQRITKEKSDSLISVMHGFKHLMKAFGATDYIACATSAMREARNGREIARMIKKKTGIEVEIIEGKREAAIIYSSHVSRNFKVSDPVLYIDVGGGSTEVTLISHRRIINTGSFKIGTVRMLQRGQLKREFDRLKAWLRTEIEAARPPVAVGTGGSINNIFKLSRKKEHKPMSAKLISEIRDYLNSFSVEERVHVLGLRPDRADVIVDAADIYLSILRWSGIKRIYVPIMGLSDGLIWMLYEKIKSRNIDL